MFYTLQMICDKDEKRIKQYKPRERLTLASSKSSQRGTIKYKIPFTAPGSVRPRTSSITKTTYGNVAVK